MKITISLPGNYGTGLNPTIYLRAVGNPLDPNAQQYYAFELSTSASATGSYSCSFNLIKHYTDAGGPHDAYLSSGGGPCQNGSTIRGIIYNQSGFDSFGGLYIDDDLYCSFAESTGTGLTTGAPGVGLWSSCGQGCGGFITRADIGARDRISPNPVNGSTIGRTVWSHRMDAQWQAATDDPNGIGVSIYGINRNGSWIAWPDEPSYSDTALAPAQTYTYTLYAIDFHGNWSTGTSFTITTPLNPVNPAISIPPMRTGVRPTGAYWGASGEQIDMMSSNLNFTVPILKAQGRGGWGVGLTLSYNSQNWRQDSGGTWNLGVDVGYGYGWRLMAGSISGSWSDPYTLDHYAFTDSSGADYALRINNGGVWKSSETIYVSYDSNTQRLYFPDGTFWVMGSESTSGEPDTGSLYATLMQDTNGNQLS